MSLTEMVVVIGAMCAITVISFKIMDESSGHHGQTIHTESQVDNAMSRQPWKDSKLSDMTSTQLSF